MFVTLQAGLCSDLDSVKQSLVVTEDSEASLAAILKHSIITSQEQIHAQFDSILSKKGTKIFIWNIRRSESYICSTVNSIRFYFSPACWGLEINFKIV